MMADVSPATIRRWTSQLQERWSNAHEYWHKWDELVHRGIRPITDPRLGNMELGADYRSPDLEDEEQKYIDFLSQASIEVEGLPGVDSPTGREEAKNAGLWANRMWADINRNRAVTRMWSNGQIRHGVKAWRLLYRNLKPPSDMEGKEAIEEWMQNRTDVFYVRDVDNYAMQWDPISNEVQRVVWEYEVSVYDASDLRRDGKEIGQKSGKYYVPVHDRMQGSGLRWVGEEEADEHHNEETSADQKIKVTVCEWRDSSQPCPKCPDKHPLWAGKEIIRSSDKRVSEGETVYKYTLPYRRYPSLRFTEGRVAALDNDVLHHYRPLMYRMFAEAITYNWAVAMQQAIANRDTSMQDYLRLNNNIPDQATSLVEGMSLPIDDSQAKSEDISIVPGQVLKWPSGLTEGLQAMADAALARFEKAKIPGILFGQGLEEAIKGPGTTAAFMLRQARIPFDTPLAQEAQAVVDMMEDIKHASQLWGDDESGMPEQRLFVNLEGTEGEGEAGNKVYLSASNLSTGPRFAVKTNPETLAEQQAREEAAWTKLQRGGIDFEQYLEEIGFKDSTAQMNRLGLQGDRELLQPMSQSAKLRSAQTMAVVLFDMDPSFLFDQSGMQPQQQQGAPDTGGAAPTIRPPALNGTQMTPGGGV